MTGEHPSADDATQPRPQPRRKQEHPDHGQPGRMPRLLHRAAQTDLTCPRFGLMIALERD